MPYEKAPSSGAFLVLSLMHILSGEPMHDLSGVDTALLDEIANRLVSEDPRGAEANFVVLGHLPARRRRIHNGGLKSPRQLGDLFTGPGEDHAPPSKMTGRLQTFSISIVRVISTSLALGLWDGVWQLKDPKWPPSYSAMETSIGMST